MYNKDNQIWSKDTNYLDTEQFIEILEKLKTYSKSLKASGYSITNTLDDVYQSQGFKADGNSVNNLFTSDKVISKILKNFQIVDIASTENVDITKTYHVKMIDGVKVGNGNRVLLKDQDNATENGVYVFTNKSFQLDKTFKKVEDYNLFYAYIKEGLVNSAKQFILERDVDGYYPTLEGEKTFIEGTNYIIRNRISYKLLQHHKLNSSSYIIQSEPIIDKNFTNTVKIGVDVYMVSENKNSLLRIGNTTTEYKIDGVEYKLLDKVINANGTVYVAGYNGTKHHVLKLQSEALVVEKEYDDTIIDFHVGSKILSLIKNSKGVFIEDVQYPNDTKEFGVIGAKTYYLTSKALELKDSDKAAIVIENIYKPSNLIIESETSLYYLSDGYPKNITISSTVLDNMTNTTLGFEYEKKSYSKRKIDKWEIKNDNLYLKGFKITNLNNDEYATSVPKISDTETQVYDGKNAYSLISSSPIKNAISSSNRLTVQFKINPKHTRVNTPVFYMGEESKYINNVKLNVNSYISFLISDTDGFPCMVISSADKVVKIKSNQTISEGVDTNITFTYHFTGSGLSSRATGRLYFNGILVGSVIDQTNTLTKNNPIDLKTINFTKSFLAKSELNYPYYSGELSEFRIWNIDLNPAQISVRLNGSISENDIYYDNLKGYWKLNDIKGEHKEEVLNENDNINYFIGGLNLDELIKSIHSVKEIQLSEKYLYALGLHKDNLIKNTLFRIDLDDEKIEDITPIIENDKINIKSIYYDSSVGKLYELRVDGIYFNNALIYSQTGVDKFTVVNYLSNEHIIFTKNDNKIYATNLVNGIHTPFYEYNTTLSSLETLFASIQYNDELKLTKLNVYLNYLVAGALKTSIISTDYNNFSFNKIIDYPLESKIKSGDFEVIDNVVYEKSVAIDASKTWDINLKSISAIVIKNGILNVLTITNDDDIVLWQYNSTKFIKYVVNQNPSLGKAKANVDFSFHNDFLIICNSNELIWYKVVKSNKLLATKWVFKLRESSKFENIHFLSSKAWLSNDTHIALLNTLNTTYGVWEHTLNYSHNNSGYIIGDSGVILKDDLEETWNIDVLRTVYKNDFNDITSTLSKTKHANGHYYDKWNGISWLIGDSGIIIKNDKDSLCVIESGVNHNLNSVSFIDENTGLIVGDNGVILATFTGKIFEPVVLPTSLKNINWNKVLCYHPNHALVLGTGVILHLTKENYLWKLDKVNNIDNITEDYVTINYQDGDNTDRYSQKLNDVVYLGDSKFIIVGERGLVCHLELIDTTVFKKPLVNILNTNSKLEWTQVSKYYDVVNNTNSLLLVSEGNGVYKTTYDNFNYNNVELLVKSNYVTKIAYWGGSDFIVFGERATVEKYSLYNDNVSGFTSVIITDTKQNQIENIKGIFKPKMLFLDYYLGRKINLHLDSKTYEIPTGTFNKASFGVGEFIEFSEYGRSENDRNFLAYQDFYYLNRRKLDGGYSFGQMDEWSRFNKRFTSAITTNYMWTGIINNPLPNEVYDKETYTWVVSKNNRLYNDTYNNIEGSLTTKINMTNTNFIVNKGDVLSIEVVKNNTTIFSDSIIAKDVLTGNIIVLSELFNGDMIADFKDATLKIRNLNYFNGTITDLQVVVSKHLIGHAYSLSFNGGMVTVNGIVNDLTKYYNLETNIKIKNINGSNVIETNNSVLYSDDVVYGTQYNIYKFLNDIKPDVFTSTYSFNLPKHTFNSSDSIKSLSGQFVEFNIRDNKIFAGEDLPIDKFVEGLFYDIKRGSNEVLRAYLSKVEISTYPQHPNKKRYTLYFDQELEQNLGAVGAIQIIGRGELEQISKDLEATDNIMFPLTNGNDLRHLNKSYFNQTRTSSAYAKFFAIDENIKTYVSSLIFLDDENDWNINILDWQTDTNLTFLPVDIHLLGVDKVFKKGVSVETKNLSIVDSKLSLKNIDLEKYNFNLVDGLTLKELENKYHWVLNADIRNAIIGESNKGLVWYQGDWIGGTWEDGTWYSGTAYNIEWVRGDLYSYDVTNNFNLYTVKESTNSTNTIWYSGEWGTGTWYNGIFINALWHNGTHHNGIFIGRWDDGIWNNGEFQGTWYNGTWYSGKFSEESTISTWHNGTWLGGDFENGVWKNGVWDETLRVKSRFGTKASLLRNAIWEYGIWKNGEFHSGLTFNEKGEVIGSANIKYSIWYNGIWSRGTFYGGVWKFGMWNNGMWVNGVWQSELEIENITKHSDTSIKIVFNKPHYYKVNELPNSLTLIGKSDSTNINAEILGYNTNVKKHTIEILDETSVIIVGSLSSYSELGYKPIVVSYWNDGSWFGGIWTNGYHNNGYWKGGIWLDGVHNNGEFGE